MVDQAWTGPSGLDIVSGWANSGWVGLDMCQPAGLATWRWRVATGLASMGATYGGPTALVHGPLVGSTVDQIHLSSFSLQFIVDQAHGTATRGKGALLLTAATKQGALGLSGASMAS